MSGNGKVFSAVKNIIMFIGSLLGGFIAVVVVLNSTIYVPLRAEIAQERKDREAAVCEEAKVRCDDDKSGLVRLESKIDKGLVVMIKQGEDIAVIKNKLGIR
jgi:hypothetical protein